MDLVGDGRINWREGEDRKVGMCRCGVVWNRDEGAMESRKLAWEAAKSKAGREQKAARPREKTSEGNSKSSTLMHG
jgi:hypothetical protein